MKKLFNESRTFGVEIEALGFSNLETVAEKLRETGLDARAERYNHENRTWWKVTTDGSLSSGGFEVVSPILKGTEGLEELEKVCNALEGMGAKVDRTCGVHVHHGARDFELTHFKRLFNFYHNWEQAIDKLMPTSRREDGNTYCHSLINSVLVRRVNNAQNIEELEDNLGGAYHRDRLRYYKLNLKSWWKYGTVEYRHHSGSLNFEKISNWVALTQVITERAREVDHLINPFTQEEFDAGQGSSPHYFKRRLRKFKKTNEIGERFHNDYKTGFTAISRFYTKREKALATA